MSKTNQLKRGSKLFVNGFKGGLLTLNMSLGLAGDLNEWLVANSESYAMSSEASIKDNAMSAEFPIGMRQYLVAKFKDVVINNLKQSDLDATQLVRLAELEKNVPASITNLDARMTMAMVKLSEELDSSK